MSIFATKPLNALRSVAVLVAVVLCGCTSESAKVAYNEDDFSEGDVVFRIGYGAESRFVSMASDGGEFSHIGLLHHDSVRGWMVIHTVPGEAKEKGTDVAKVEPVDSFFLPSRAQKGGVGHIDCDSAVKARAVQYALGKVAAAVPFDYDYQLSDTTAMYCTELVWHSYLAQGIDLTEGKRTKLPAFSTDSEYILPSDIANGTYINNLLTY